MYVGDAHWSRHSCLGAQDAWDDAGHLVGLGIPMFFYCCSSSRCIGRHRYRCTESGSSRGIGALDTEEQESSTLVRI